MKAFEQTPETKKPSFLKRAFLIIFYLAPILRIAEDILDSFLAAVFSL